MKKTLWVVVVIGLVGLVALHIVGGLVGLGQGLRMAMEAK